MAKNRNKKPRFAASLVQRSSVTRSGRPFSASSPTMSESDVAAVQNQSCGSLSGNPNQLAVSSNCLPSFSKDNSPGVNVAVPDALPAAPSSSCIPDIHDFVANSLQSIPVSGLCAATESTPLSQFLTTGKDSRWAVVDGLSLADRINIVNVDSVENREMHIANQGVAFDKGIIDNVDCVDGSALQGSASLFPVGSSPSLGDAANDLIRPFPATDTGSAPCNHPPSDNIPSSKGLGWSSLFKTLPKAAGAYIPRSFVSSNVEGVAIPPPEVIQAGIEQWSDFLVGFFLDITPSYSVVREQCNRYWKLRGKLHVQLIDSMFYFKFSNSEDKLRVLEAGPLIIEGKPFIITPWSVSIGTVRERVLSIPVWATFTHIPSVLQPLIGLNWLASLIGNLRCFDSSTVERKNLKYARALIEISPSKPLPSKLKVRIAEGQDVEVNGHYSWKPEICTSCKSFGHSIESCTSQSPSVKIPLCRPVLKWVPKPVTSAPLHKGASVPTEQPIIHDLSSPPPVAAPVVASSIPQPTVPKDDSKIIWNRHEKAWVHELSEMRYWPNNGSYRMYVGDDGEERTLIYHVVGEGLSLATEGEAGVRNNRLLEDGSWDRKYLYGSDSTGYVPNLALLFSDFSHVMGPVDTSSSDDEA